MKTIKKYLVYIITFFILLLFLGLFLSYDFYQKTTISASIDTIEMTFIYKDKIYKYNTSKLENIKNFYLNSIAQKNNRLSSPYERAELLKKVLKLGFTPLQSFKYCFAGLEEVIKSMQKDINCVPCDAKMTFNPNASPYFFFEKEKIGYDLNLYDLANEIIDKLKINHKININLRPKKLLPTIFYEDLKDYANLKSSFYTSFNQNNLNRVHNIRLAIGKFNGLKFEKGKEYSFNNITGKRNEQNGYRPAKVIIDKKYVEDFGGGVCQASTTLYNTLLLSNVDILELHSHSLISSYVNMGFDAMVNFGTSDLRWVNNTETDLFVRTYVQENRVGVQIFGKPNQDIVTYKRVTEIEKQLEPKKEQTIVDTKGEYQNLVNFEDESAYIQVPKKGYKVRAILEIYKNNELIERKFLRRVTYQAVQGIKVVGTKTRPKTIENQDFNELNEQTINFWQKYINTLF